MKVNATTLADLFRVTPRTVTNWVNSDPPCPSRMRGRNREFDLADVIEWHAAGIRREYEKDELDPLEQARARLTTTQGLIAEIELARKRAEVIPLEVHEKVCGELAERLRAVLINVPSNYALDLERAGLDPAVAEAVLEHLATELTKALRAPADELEAEPPQSEEAA